DGQRTVGERGGGYADADAAQFSGDLVLGDSACVRACQGPRVGTDGRLCRPRDRVLDVRCQWISPISTRNVEGEESLNADDAHSKEPLLPLSSPRLRVSKRLSPLLDRLDRELGRMSANAPLDSIALAALDLLHTPAHLVQIV